MIALVFSEFLDVSEGFIVKSKGFQGQVEQSCQIQLYSLVTYNESRM